MTKENNIICCLVKLSEEHKNYIISLENNYTDEDFDFQHFIKWLKKKNK